MPQPPPRRRRASEPMASAPHPLLERAQLRAVLSTLLIPLAARAHGGRYFPWLECVDEVAADLLARLDVDVNAILDDLPTVFNVLWRTQALKDAGRLFFAEHPDALGVNIGCGLSQHFQWLDTGANRWLDADLPEVIALRQQLLPPCCARAGQAEVDLAKPGWWRRLGLPEGSGAAPVWLLCEGVLMYLHPEQVQAVLSEFARYAPKGSHMVLDVLTGQAVGYAAYHASVGPTGAEFLWGINRLTELAAMHQRLVLLREQSAAQGYGWAGLAMDTLWRAWMGASLYGLATLGVAE